MRSFLLLLLSLSVASSAPIDLSHLNDVRLGVFDLTRSALARNQSERGPSNYFLSTGGTLCANVEYDSPIYAAPSGWKTHQMHHGILSNTTNTIAWSRESAWSTEVAYAKQHPLRVLSTLSRALTNPVAYVTPASDSLLPVIDSSTVSLPSTGWFDLNYKSSPRVGFEICQREDSVNSSLHSASVVPPVAANMLVQWVAFEGHLFEGAHSGRDRLPSTAESYRGVVCEWVSFKHRYAEPPMLFFSLEHQTVGHHPTEHMDTVWANQILPHKAQICTRDSPVFSDAEGHLPTHVNFLTFPYYASQLPPHIAEGMAYASIPLRWPAKVPGMKAIGVCVDVPFTSQLEDGSGSTRQEPYVHTPLVFVNTNRRGVVNGGGTLGEAEKTAATTAWVEFANSKGFRACVSKMSYDTEMDIANAPTHLDYMAFTSDIFNTPSYDRMRTSVDGYLYIKNLNESFFEQKNFDSHQAKVQRFTEALEEWLSDMADIQRERMYVRRRFINFKEFMSVEFTILPNIAFARKEHHREAGRKLSPRARTPMQALQAIDDMVSKDAGHIPASKNLHPFLTPLEDGNHPNGMMSAELRYRLDCVVSAYQTVGNCSQSSCGGIGGWVHQSRRVLVQSTPGAQECPPLHRYISCNYAPCDRRFNGRGSTFYALMQDENEGTNKSSKLYIVTSSGLVVEHLEVPWWSIIVASVVGLIVVSTCAVGAYFYTSICRGKQRQAPSNAKVGVVSFSEQTGDIIPVQTIGVKYAEFQDLDDNDLEDVQVELPQRV
eukprot:GHVS01070844.1.p1 GENE.GHVS01070844.1~~GHVS01070844.1.p1  ORF type:complete len:810 (+),score=107.58 GHVS01070844.1:118-2430(+)